MTKYISEERVDQDNDDFILRLVCLFSSHAMLAGALIYLGLTNPFTDRAAHTHEAEDRASLDYCENLGKKLPRQSVSLLLKSMCWAVMGSVAATASALV